METMLFADEVVAPDELDDLPEAKDLKASERELTMAQQLIDSLSSDFEPEKYEDTYRERIMEVVKQKEAGEEISVPEPVAEDAPVVDLMEALRRSLDQVSTGKKKTAKADADAGKKVTSIKAAKNKAEA